MATGRVGGTKSKISGQVGDDIYQVVKQPDGTYMQIVYEKGVRTESVTSPRLQAQRMCTCMVESLMRDIKKVVQISMQSAKNKTTSANSWASFNLSLVAQDCKTHWDSYGDFIYPGRGNKNTLSDNLGGCYMLSAGNGSINLFDGKWSEYDPFWLLDGWTNRTHLWYGLNFEVPENCNTIGQFMNARHFTRLDKFIFCCYHDWWTGPEPGYLTDNHTKHEYIIGEFNTELNNNTPISEESLRNLFTFTGTFQPSIYFYKNNPRKFTIGIETDDEAEDYVYLYGAFTISYATGKKLITSSYYEPTSGDKGAWLANHRPCDVFGTWMGEPQIKPYPNIFQ